MPRLPAVNLVKSSVFSNKTVSFSIITSGSHLIFYHPVSRRRAVIPRHNRDLAKETLISLLREAGFTREEWPALYQEGEHYAGALHHLRSPQIMQMHNPF
jgi:hypothetical protein